MPYNLRSRMENLYSKKKKRILVVIHLKRRIMFQSNLNQNLKNKIVLVVSNKVSDTNIGPTNKPEVILYYNKHKGGTDVFDKLCHAYSTTHSTKRWPMRFFWYA